MRQQSLPDDDNSAWVPCREVAAELNRHHYLGATSRGHAYRDAVGIIVLAPPTSRRLPNRWLDLTRWCILHRVMNAGSMQRARCIRAIRLRFPEVSTIVSYSDPAHGHDGALYRACNWWWAPTWHRLRPPPSGQVSWTRGVTASVKDRWVFPVRDDAERISILTAKDASILKRMPWARYQEPGGASYKSFRLLAAQLEDVT